MAVGHLSAQGCMHAAVPLSHPPQLGPLPGCEHLQPCSGVSTTNQSNGARRAEQRSAVHVAQGHAAAEDLRFRNICCC